MIPLINTACATQGSYSDITDTTFWICGHLGKQLNPLSTLKYNLLIKKWEDHRNEDDPLCGGGNEMNRALGHVCAHIG